MRETVLAGTQHHAIAQRCNEQTYSLLLLDVDALGAPKSQGLGSPSEDKLRNCETGGELQKGKNSMGIALTGNVC